jgi:hypothetical protein
MFIASSILLLRKFTQSMVVMPVLNEFTIFCQLRDWMQGNFNIVYLCTIILEMQTKKITADHPPNQ